MKIGLLALQGAFVEHKKKLAALDVDSFEIRQKKDLQKSFDGLILPGGESTVMGKLLYSLDLFDPILALLQNDFPVFGTCAGLILLAKTIVNGTPSHFGTLCMKVRRNAYGRQLGSFSARADFAGKGEIPMTFIRAPQIESVWGDTQVLATIDKQIVAARQDRQLVTAFHPELGPDNTVHQYFLNMIKA